MAPFQSSRRPGDIVLAVLVSEIRDSGRTMPGNVPAATRTLAVLRALAAAPGPVTA